MSHGVAARTATRVLIVEDHILFAESLELALSMEGYQVRRLSPSDTSTAPAALVGAATRIRPRIVLLDLDLGSFGDGSRLIHPLAQSGAQVVVITASAEHGRWGECLRLGARTVLAKTRPLNDILSTVRRLSQGLSVMSHEEREELLGEWYDQRRELQERRAQLESLTGREREVLGHLMAGRGVRDIARVSVVSEATVRTQVKSILAKLEVSSQLAAVGVAHNVGWRPPPSEAS